MEKKKIIKILSQCCIFYCIVNLSCVYVLMFQEMLGELFTPVETPEAPNRGFFKGLFGGGAQSLDREELCMSKPTHAHIYSSSLLYPADSHHASLPVFLSFPAFAQLVSYRPERHLEAWPSTSQARAASRA